MAEIYGNPTVTPINPDAFSGGGSFKVDSEYNPESENPQSGKALAPVLNNRPALYRQGVTYYPNQWVVANIVESGTSQSYTAYLLCMAEHKAESDEISASEMNRYFSTTIPLFIAEAIRSQEARKDEKGNVIHATYATKEELNNIGGGGTVNQKPYEIIQKIIIGYSVLTSKPADWDTNFTSYYKNTGTLVEPVYEALTNFETWEIGKYYSFTNTAFSGLMDIKKYIDGTDYQLSAINVYINIPDGSTEWGAGSPNFVVFLDGDNLTQYPCGYFTFSKTAKGVCVGYAELKNGRLFGGTIDYVLSATGLGTVKSSPYGCGIKAGDKITGVRIGSSNSKLPVNSVITISGVKK